MKRVRTVFGQAVCSICLLGLVSQGAWAQENEGPAKEVAKTLQTKDGLPLAITYWASPLKTEGGVIVFLHSRNGSQLEWGPVPKQMQEKGFAVITVDLRGHGLSKGTDAGSKSKGAALDSSSLKARDYQAMVVGDMEAVKKFIFEEHQDRKLNMNKTCLVGADLGAAVALEWAAYDWLKKPHNDGVAGNQTPRGQDVRALVLLSPDGSVPGINLTDALRTLRTPLFQVSMLFGVGNKDKQDKGQTKKLYDQAATPDANKTRMFYEEYDIGNRGAGLLASPKAMAQMQGFLEKFGQQATSEWRDRESRIGKKR